MGEHRRGRFGSVIGVALLVVLGGAPVACRPGPAAPTSTPPPPPNNYNVILISVDTLRADRLNCYGYNQRKVSPHIDALAADGILFENHISASPWTTPAHLSMLTSLYPSAHGVTASFRDLMDQVGQNRLFNKLPESVTTLAEILAANGLATGAFTAGLTLDPKIGFDQGFSLYTTSMYKLNQKNTALLFRWIKKHRRQPFFLFWHTFEVHAPYLQTTFLDDVLHPQTATLVRDGVAEMARQLGRGGLARQTTIRFLKQHQAYTPEVCDALYVGGIHSFDRWLGQLIETLRDLGLYDRTLIILTSDHGEEFGDHDPQSIYDQHGHTLYEELVRVPLIIKLPRQQRAGTRVASVSRTVDLLPSILEVLSIAPPDIRLQGTSLQPAWQGQTPAGPGLAFSESLAGYNEKKCVRTDRYKYVLSISARSVARYGRGHIPDQLDHRELYDLLADPAEKINLLDSPQGQRYADLTRVLEQRLRRHVQVESPTPEQAQLDQRTIEGLKALGYIR